MRPLVRSEQLRLRMPKEVKEAIAKKANKLGITITAYIETLVMKDSKEEILRIEDISSGRV